MNPDNLWNLLTLATTALTICVTVLLWFLTDYLNRIFLREPSDLIEAQTRFSSERIVIVAIGAMLVILLGSLSCYVALKNLSRLGIPPWTPEFYLFLTSVLLPVVLALFALFALWGGIGIENIRRAFKRLIEKPLTFQPEDLELDRAELVNTLTHSKLSCDYAVFREWTNALSAVRANEKSWGLGRGFLKSNEWILVSLVNKYWGYYVDDNEQDLCRKLPNRIESVLASGLEKRGAEFAVIHRRHVPIAAAACAMFKQQVDKNRRGKI